MFQMAPRGRGRARGRAAGGPDVPGQPDGDAAPPTLLHGQDQVVCGVPLIMQK